MAILTTKATEARKKTASTKLTNDELAAFEQFASDQGKSPGELIRELILARDERRWWSYRHRPHTARDHRRPASLDECS